MLTFLILSQFDHTALKWNLPNIMLQESKFICYTSQGNTPLGSPVCENPYEKCKGWTFWAIAKSEWHYSAEQIKIDYNSPGLAVNKTCLNFLYTAYFTPSRDTTITNLTTR